MSEKDIMWMDKCIAEPNRYKIIVDNDEVFVTDNITKEYDDDFMGDTTHMFSSFGYELVCDLLIYMGCDAEIM